MEQSEDIPERFLRTLVELEFAHSIAFADAFLGGSEVAVLEEVAAEEEDLQEPYREWLYLRSLQ